MRFELRRVQWEPTGEGYTVVDHVRQAVPDPWKNLLFGKVKVSYTARGPYAQDVAYIELHNLDDLLEFAASVRHSLVLEANGPVLTIYDDYME